MEKKMENKNLEVFSNAPVPQAVLKSKNGEPFPYDEFESMHYDFICRCEGDEWPE